MIPLTNLLYLSIVLSVTLLHSSPLIHCQILGDDDTDLPPSPVNNSQSAVNVTAVDSSPLEYNLTEIQSSSTASPSAVSQVSSSETATPALIDKRFLTTWKLESSDNFEEFLKELGVGYFTRKVAAMTKQMVSYFRYPDGDYGIKVTSRLYNRTIKFKLGQEFWDEAPGGIKVRSVFSVNGDALVQIMYADKTAKVTRRIKGDRMIVESRIGDVICTRVYKRFN